uniref:Transmembrane channel-like protein n=1 Tax=Poecilia reticulata TaxID=8081 RepID=A0A3P9NPL7_POERE
MFSPTNFRQVQQMQAPAQFSGGSWKQKKTIFVRKFKSNAREFLYFFSLWGKTLQKIGGNFGGGVQSYFIFLRFLVVLNFVSFLLIAGFVLIPSIVFRSRYLNCLKYDPNPQGLVVFYEFFLDLLSGTGFMEYSYMFYGYYNNTVVVTSLVGSDFSYNLPLAYLLTAVFYFAFCLIFAVRTGGSDVRSYSMIVFTGWDYGCLGSKATKLKQRNIYYRLQVDLEEERLKKHAASLTLCNKVTLYSLRVLMFFVAIGLIVATFFAIASATTFSQVVCVKLASCKNSNVQGILGLLYTYLPSIVITTGNFLVPLLCDQIALLEKYPPSATVVVALLRAVVLRLVSLGILLYTLWNQIECHGSTDMCPCHYNHNNYQVNCWETSVGQEMYKLMLFDLLVSIALLVLVEFPRRMVVDHWSCKLTQWVGRQEFVVPSNVLGLVYGQTVVWTGALFCPLLPLINTVKFVILFYCKKITLFNNCRPALRTFRSTTSAFFFLAVLLFGWILALVVMIYSVAEIHPSFACGPFRSFFRMWNIVPESLSILPKGTRDFLFFIGSQAFSVPLFAASCVFMCYFIALASIYGKSVAMLRAQLKLVCVFLFITVK